MFAKYSVVTSNVLIVHIYVFLLSVFVSLHLQSLTANACAPAKFFAWAKHAASTLSFVILFHNVKSASLVFSIVVLFCGTVNVPLFWELTVGFAEPN